jgi:hypothetical protein
VGVVGVVDSEVMVVGLANVGWYDVVGGMVVASILVGGISGSGGVVVVVWSSFVVGVVKSCVGGVVDIVLQRLLLPSEFPTLLFPSVVRGKSWSHLLILFFVGS